MVKPVSNNRMAIIAFLLWVWYLKRPQKKAVSGGKVNVNLYNLFRRQLQGQSVGAGEALVQTLGFGQFVFKIIPQRVQFAFVEHQFFALRMVFQCLGGC